MNQFYQKEIGGILGAVLLSASPVFAGQTRGYSPSYPNNRIAGSEHTYQEGYATTKTCFRTEYREEYVPGTEDDPGYVRSWKETIEFPCKRFNTKERRESKVIRTYEEYDTNDCTDGKVAGMLLGGAAGAAMSRGDGRWWAIPLGAVVGSHIGCDAAGG